MAKYSVQTCHLNVSKMEPKEVAGLSLAFPDVLRKESPFSSILSALAKRLSQMASATVGSPRISCQVEKGR